MSKELLQIMLLAAVSDGKIHPEERQMLQTYRKLYAPLRDISQDEFDDVNVILYNQLNAEGMKLQYIIEDIGKKMPKEQKGMAYALAAEVCASNFELHPQEKALLSLIAEVWNIKPSIVSAVQVSLDLRYLK